MILYRITKERESSTGGYGKVPPSRYVDKHEVVITERKARASQCLAAAVSANKYFERMGKGSRYRCKVEILDLTGDGPYTFEFMKEVEFPQWT